MLILGLQKLTLLDYPGLVACTIFTAGCNFHCPFCHNASLVRAGSKPGGIDESEVFRFLEMRRSLLDGVVLSGGEPLLQDDLERVLKKIRSMGFQVKLDTNGSRPDKLKSLVEKGLVDYAAMDIKNAPELYPVTTGTAGVDLDAVRRSKDFLISGKIPYEFRTTAVKGLHTEESLVEAARFIEGAKAYYLQRYSDQGEILQPEGLSAFSDEEMHRILRDVQTVIPEAKLRGMENE